MDTSLLDMLHNASDVHLLAVGNYIDVDLYCVLEI